MTIASLLRQIVHASRNTTKRPTITITLKNGTKFERVETEALDEENDCVLLYQAGWYASIGVVLSEIASLKVESTNRLYPHLGNE